MIALPYLGVLHFAGADAGTFLQAQLSADILALAEGESTLAAYCSPKGQVIAVTLVNRQADAWHMLLSSSLLAGLEQRLRMYVLRSKVDITASGQATVYAVPGAATVAPETDIIRLPGLDLQYCVADAGVPASNPSTSASAGQLQLQSPAHWHRHELSQGLSWLNPASSERFVPQMLGLERLGAVSFSKGCYPGQEIVARARYLGTVKRKPLIVETDNSPGLTAGDAVMLQTRAGGETEAVVVDVATADDLPAMALLVTSLEPSEEISALLCKGQAHSARRIVRPA